MSDMQKIQSALLDLQLAEEAVKNGVEMYFRAKKKLELLVAPKAPARKRKGLSPAAKEKIKAGYKKSLNKK